MDIKLSIDDKQVRELLTKLQSKVKNLNPVMFAIAGIMHVHDALRVF